MQRIQSVDFFRILAIISIIAIHTSPFQEDAETTHSFYKFTYIFINQISRYAVPFFFIISGYFWGIKIKDSHEIIQHSFTMSKRLVFLFIIWSCIYLVPFDMTMFYEEGIASVIKLTYTNFIEVIENPVRTLVYGTKSHLWFLMALVFSISISTTFIYFDRKKELIIFAIILYLFGLLAKAYANTPIGFDIGFNTRNGPFFGTIFFVSGYVMSGLTINKKWLWYGASLFFFGSLFHLSETYILYSFYDLDITNDYVLTTYIMGIGIAMMALSNHPIFQTKKDLKKLGKMTLGIYLVHFNFCRYICAYR